MTQPFQPGYYGDLQYAAEMQAAGGMQVPIIQSESEIAKQVSPFLKSIEPANIWTET